MWVPKPFEPKNPELVLQHIQKNSFATLVGHDGHKSIASHIPLMLSKIEQKNVLYGHVSIANELKNCFDGKHEILAIFMQTHSYISSSWYDHINVPTWNYIAVHVYGHAEKISGQELYKSIETLVDAFEEDRPERFHLADMSEKMMNDHFRGLVAFRMYVDRIEAAYKLSQNRDDKNQDAIIEKLMFEGDPLSVEIAREMKMNRT